jgi:hypothetical protein
LEWDEFLSLRSYFPLIGCAGAFAGASPTQWRSPALPLLFFPLPTSELHSSGISCQDHRLAGNLGAGEVGLLGRYAKNANSKTRLQFAPRLPSFIAMNRKPPFSLNSPIEASYGVSLLQNQHPGSDSVKAFNETGIL